MPDPRSYTPTRRVLDGRLPPCFDPSQPLSTQFNQPATASVINSYDPLADPLCSSMPSIEYLFTNPNYFRSIFNVFFISHDQNRHWKYSSEWILDLITVQLQFFHSRATAGGGMVYKI